MYLYGTVYLFCNCYCAFSNIIGCDELYRRPRRLRRFSSYARWRTLYEISCKIIFNYFIILPYPANFKFFRKNTCSGCRFCCNRSFFMIQYKEIGCAQKFQLATFHFQHYFRCTLLVFVTILYNFCIEFYCWQWYNWHILVLLCKNPSVLQPKDCIFQLTTSG